MPVVVVTRSSLANRLDGDCCTQRASSCSRSAPRGCGTSTHRIERGHVAPRVRNRASRRRDSTSSASSSVISAARPIRWSCGSSASTTRRGPMIRTRLSAVRRKSIPNCGASSRRRAAVMRGVIGRARRHLFRLQSRHLAHVRQFPSWRAWARMNALGAIERCSRGTNMRACLPRTLRSA